MKILSKKLRYFTNRKSFISIKWIIKITKFISLKRSIFIQPVRSFMGSFPCSKNYNSESKRSMTTRWGEIKNKTHNSEPSKHLNNDIKHIYNWKYLGKSF